MPDFVPDFYMTPYHELDTKFLVSAARDEEGDWAGRITYAYGMSPLPIPNTLSKSTLFSPNHPSNLSSISIRQPTSRHTGLEGFQSRFFSSNKTSRIPHSNDHPSHDTAPSPRSKPERSPKDVILRKGSTGSSPTTSRPTVTLGARKSYRVARSVSDLAEDPHSIPSPAENYRLRPVTSHVAPQSRSPASFCVPLKRRRDESEEQFLSFWDREYDSFSDTSMSSGSSESLDCDPQQPSYGTNARCVDGRLHPEPAKDDCEMIEATTRRILASLRREKEYRKRDGIFPSLVGADTYRSRSGEVLDGISCHARQRIVNWLLEVLPMLDDDYTDVLGVHLNDGNETRFHAVLLFSRFFSRQGFSRASKPSVEIQDGSVSALEKLELYWSIAIACFTLSVKMHHDFTHPLQPIHSDSFRAMSYHPIAYEDLEKYQIDVLKRLDYQIYDTTPQTYFSELFDALPSVRHVLRLRHSWRDVQQCAWELLTLAMKDSHFVEYSISLLAAGVLVESIYDVVTVEENSVVAAEEPTMPPVIISISDELLDDIAIATEDIIDILEISEAESNDCREWIGNLRVY